MIEEELEIIKNKIKDDNFDSSDLNECEKKLLKIEKKLIQIENKFNNSAKSDNSDNSDKINSDLDTDSDCEININKVIQEINKLNTNLTNINTNINIEKLIENYIDFKEKLSLLKTKNEDFKLKIDYL